MPMTHSDQLLTIITGGITAIAQFVTDAMKKPALVRAPLVRAHERDRETYDDNCDMFGIDPAECREQWSELQEVLAALSKVRLNGNQPFDVQAMGGTEQPFYDLKLREFLPEPGEHSGYQLSLFGLPASVTARKGRGPRYSSKYQPYDPLYPWPSPMFVARNGYLTIWGDGEQPYKHVRRNPKHTSSGGMELMVSQWVALAEFLEQFGVLDPTWVRLSGDFEDLEISIDDMGDFHVAGAAHPAGNVFFMIRAHHLRGKDSVAYRPRNRRWLIVDES